jgi:hypothetical protein
VPDTPSAELLSASTVAIRDCMGARPGETILIVTDEPLRRIGYALQHAARALGHEVVLAEMLPRRSNGEEPPPQIADLMTSMDVVLCPTLTHVAGPLPQVPVWARFLASPKTSWSVA